MNHKYMDTTCEYLFTCCSRSTRSSSVAYSTQPGILLESTEVPNFSGMPAPATALSTAIRRAIGLQI